MRIAVIDIGTNTVLMLVADLQKNVAPFIMRDEHSIARLGEGVDNTHRISDAAYDRFAGIITRYNEIIEELNVDRVVAFATSAMRDAENRDDIISRTRVERGIEIELLSGADEARWSYQGAIFGIRVSELTGAIATLDIGGGSTEISFGNNDNYLHGASINVGAVRMKERFLNVISEQNERAARQYIREQIFAMDLPISNPDILIAVAGTPTSLAAMKHRLDHFDASVVDGTIIYRDELKKMIGEIFSIGADELVRRYPVISTARADILSAGALILDEAMSALSAESVRVSTKGVRYGILKREIFREEDSQPV